MATKSASAKRTFVESGIRSSVVSWQGLANGDDGEPICTSSESISVQVEGTFGTGGTVVLEGSNDGTNWRTLKDRQGTAISLTAAGVRQLGEITEKIRPRVTAGDGATSLSVHAYLLRP